MALTRRELAGVLSASVLAPAQGAPQAPAQESAEQLLAAAKERLRRNAETLAKVRVPTATEPAFQFRAS